MLFDNTPEKRIAREADKVASLKEDLDAISWGRVLEIGKQLQGKGAAEAELGAELVSIAQSNLSLATRLGIDPAPLENRVMASGVKIVEGGLAQAAIDASRVPVGSGAASPSPTASRGEAGRARPRGQRVRRRDTADRAAGIVLDLHRETRIWDGRRRPVFERADGGVQKAR